MAQLLRMASLERTPSLTASIIHFIRPRVSDGRSADALRNRCALSKYYGFAHAQAEKKASVRQKRIIRLYEGGRSLTLTSSNSHVETIESTTYPEIDYFSVSKEKGPNGDYVLYDELAGACVADGISGAPLGDAISRYACHVAMQALRDGYSASAAITSARERVSRFVADVDSPRSGASIVVAHINANRLEAAWAGDTALFVLRQDSGHTLLISSLDLNSFTNIPPLGEERCGEVGSLSLPLDTINALAICTDGAWRSTGSDRIGKLLAQSTTARKTVAQIVFGHHSRDDSTALVAKFHKTCCNC